MRTFAATSWATFTVFLNGSQETKTKVIVLISVNWEKRRGRGFCIILTKYHITINPLKPMAPARRVNVTQITSTSNFLATLFK